MPHDYTDQEGLKGIDPKRQAIPALRGYDYQVWQSLFRWITLGEDEVLFLEGAEDLDVLRAGEAETVQVKETARSGNVTLNSANVTEAIAHFWEHQGKNPGRVVRFRFLTTSARGTEQSNPFGGVRGLDYWDQCKRPNTDLRPLREFLSSKTDLPASLREFVSNAPDDELRNNLIKRIEWDTGQGDQSYIEELVQRRAIAHGAQVYALPPSESLRVVPHLFRHVWAVICREDDRRLDYADFARLFEEHSTIRITRQELQLRASSSGMALGLGLGAMAGAGTAELGLVTEAAPEAYALPSFRQLARRERLVSDLRARLNLKGILVLKGSSGMGKSTLAALIAAGDDARWRRLDMRDIEPERIKEHLIYATLTDVEESDPADYIIDDLNFDKQPSHYERALAGFVHTVTARGGRVIITTQGELPTRLALAFNLPQEVLFNVPELTEEEIGEVALSNGCPAGKKLETWQHIIQTNTLGHPQLVHARVRNVAAAGWRDPEVKDVFTTEAVEDVRQEARRRLQEELPSQEARTLAYRLSVFTAYFKRGHALYLAKHPPAISTPGEAFDLLVGPWVEQLAHGYHRLSPLLKDSAERIFGSEEVKFLHKTAAYAYLTEKVLTPTVLSGVLLHGLLGEVPEPLMAVSSAAIKIEDQDWPAVSREIDWFARISLHPGEKLFKPAPLTSLILRGLQFKVTAAVDSADLALKVVTSWEHELKAFDEYREDEGFLLARMAAQLIFNTILFRLDVPISLKTVVNAIADTLILIRECRAAAASGDKVVQQALEISPDNLDDVETYVFTAAARCKRADDVADFLEALEGQESEAAGAIWAQLGADVYTAALLVDAAWLREIKEASPDWARDLEVIERVAEQGLSRKADAVVATAYRAKAIILKEYASDGGDAIDILGEGSSKLGYEHPVIQDYLAKVHMLDGRYRDAIEVWRNIPAEAGDEQYSTRIFSHREAIICAGRLGEWTSVAQYALDGEKAARRLLHLGDAVAVGFLTEHAFALWKSGDFQNALAAFAQVLEALGTLPPPDGDIKSYTLHLRILHAIKWIGQNTTSEENQYEPQSGSFSDPQFDESIRGKPIPPSLFYWYYLADAEYKVRAEAGIIQRLNVEAQRFDIPLVQTQIEELRLKYSLRNLDLESIVEGYARYARSARAFSDSKNSPIPASFDAQMLIALTFAALAKLIEADRLAEAPVERWRADAKSHGFLDPTVEKFFDFVGRAVRADQETLLGVLNDPSQTVESRLITALIISSSKSLDPEYRFIANIHLITTGYAYAMWHEETEAIDGRLVADGWAETAENQRFALLSPATTAPEILSVCLDKSTLGLKKAARVLLAARDAVRIKLPDHIVTKLQKMAE